MLFIIMVCLIVGAANNKNQLGEFQGQADDLWSE